MPPKAAAPKAEGTPLLASAGPSEPLSQVTGARTLATTWIVLGHFLGEPRGALAPFLARGQVAVAFYIVLSGYITQTAYGSRSYDRWSQCSTFYSRRFGRIMLTYYFTCAVGLAQRALQGQLLPAADYVLPLLMLDGWDPTARLTQPQPNLNPAGWTLSTLVLPWLLYPAFNTLFGKLRAGGGGGARVFPVAFVVCALVAIAPAFALCLSRHDLAAGERIPRSASLYLYQFPPARLAEFLLGMVAAELAQQPRLAAWAGWSVVGTACLVAVLCCAAVLPYAGLGRVDVEAVYISAL